MNQKEQELLRQYFNREYKIEIDNWHTERSVVVAITERPLGEGELWADLFNKTRVKLANVNTDDVTVYKPLPDWTDEHNLV